MTTKKVKDNTEKEHILVCLSASPSNAKIVKTAAKMAAAYGGIFTALYVRTPDSDKMDEESKKRLQYHIRLVENLLSVTRIEEGRMKFNMSVQLMDEVIDEAMKHINRKASEHKVIVECKDELLLARMDAKLIIQVIINLVDNAVKYTPAGSNIKVTAENKEGFVSVSISDDGEGIPDAIKPKLFEMFYTGDNKIADSRRSLGLGLSLCRSIVNAHGGELILTDNKPHGSVFTFTVPSCEVNINE